MLKDIGVIRKASKSSKIFDKYCWHLYGCLCTPSEYIRLCHEAYVKSPISKNNALNGKMFELMISSLCVKENIKPVFLQASVAFVPNGIRCNLIFARTISNKSKHKNQFAREI